VRSSFTEALHNLYKKHEPSGRDMQTWAISISTWLSVFIMESFHGNKTLPDKTSEVMLPRPYEEHEWVTVQTVYRTYDNHFAKV